MVAAISYSLKEKNAGSFFKSLQTSLTDANCSTKLYVSILLGYFASNSFAINAEVTVGCFAKDNFFCVLVVSRDVQWNKLVCT